MTKKNKKPSVEIPELKTWDALCNAVMLSNEEKCFQLLEAEKKGKARREFLTRIHCRYNKLRAQRERNELSECAKT